MRHKLYSFDLLNEKGYSGIPENIQHSPEEDSENARKREEVMTCLVETAKSVLTERQQEIIFRRMAGEKQVQIAKALGLSKSSVSRTYHRGMKKLSEHTKYLELFLR